MNREDFKNAWREPIAKAFEELYAKEAAIDVEKMQEDLYINSNKSIEKQIRAAQSPSIDPNDLPAYNTPIATLKAMWRVRFGERWVSNKEVLGDTFYTHALGRLESIDAMETFHGGKRFVRLREDA